MTRTLHAAAMPEQAEDKRSKRGSNPDREGGREICGNGERNEKQRLDHSSLCPWVVSAPSLTVGLLPSYYCFAPAALLLAASGLGAL